MGIMIDADELKNIVEYMCDEDGSEEAQKWCKWFTGVIQAQENRKDKCEKDDNTIVSAINERYQKMGMTIDEAVKVIHKMLAYTDLSVRANLKADMLDACHMAIEIMRKYQQLEDFARWVAEEIIDEDMWELNHLSFAELACRKLVKLGIMQKSNGEYLYEVLEDGNVD